MSERARQLARKGELYLQEAILDVLYNAYPKSSYGLGPTEISRRAGIYREVGTAQMNSAIAAGFFNQLHEHGKVERVDQAPRSGSSKRGRGGWRLTTEEYNRRGNATQIN